MVTGYITFWMVLGTPQTGVWCDKCMLPSRVRFPIYRINEGGVALHCNVLSCMECGPYADAAEDQGEDD